MPLRKVVLSHAFWRSHFGGRAEAIGQDLVLNGDHFTVVGVGPEGYHGTTVLSPDVWVPLTAGSHGLPSDDMLRGRENQWLIMAGRLKPGVSIARAQAFLDTFTSDLRRAYPGIYGHIGLAAVPASRIPAFGIAVRRARFSGCSWGWPGSCCSSRA